MEDQVVNQHVTGYVDNMSVVCAFNNLGARDLRLNRVVVNIVQWAYERNIRISLTWTPSKEELADELSRSLPVTEAKLRPKLRQLIIDFFAPTLDLFGSENNRLHESIHYCSRYNEKPAECNNGLAWPVDVDRVVYAFPPLVLRQAAAKVILRHLKKCIMVVTVKDVAVTNYVLLLKNFEWIIDLSAVGNMVIRPASKRCAIDAVIDHFAYYRSLDGCWLVGRGFSDSLCREFIEHVNQRYWGAETTALSRFDCVINQNAGAKSERHKATYKRL